MTTGSHHEHSHGRRSDRALGRLKLALGLTFFYMIAEAVGGWLSNSLALIADAGHMLTDVAAMSLTLFAIWFASRPATSKKTYGYYRLEILAAFVNGIALVLLSIWVIIEAFSRWSAPEAIAGTEMTLIAAGGLVVNVIAAFLLHSEHKHDLNMRGAFLHVIGDLLGSVAAIVAGGLILLYGWVWADALSSVLISVIIILGAWRLILDSVNVLLEGTPRHISLSAVETSIIETPGVAGVHDLHVWTISSGIDALSAHINHDDSVSHSELLQIVRNKLHDRFGIDHLTIQMETLDLEAEAVYVCETGTKCFEPTQRATARHGG
ncbi:MAG TPA: cation diffusion facilitator family transporter [Pyrinomonadaceae bacterium]|nr:cation diffusion facilitator family transporter [Pyrinomonadaceae bacterium]